MVAGRIVIMKRVHLGMRVGRCIRDVVDCTMLWREAKNVFLNRMLFEWEGGLTTDMPDFDQCMLIDLECSDKLLGGRVKSGLDIVGQQDTAITTWLANRLSGQRGWRVWRVSILLGEVTRLHTLVVRLLGCFLHRYVRGGLVTLQRSGSFSEGGSC